MKPRDQSGRPLTKLEREALEEFERRLGKYPQPGIEGEHQVFLERVRKTKKP
jgi:hypothetical protein